MVLGESLWCMVLGAWFCAYSFWHMALALGRWFWVYGFGCMVLGVWFGFGCIDFWV